MQVKKVGTTRGRKAVSLTLEMSFEEANVIVSLVRASIEGGYDWVGFVDEVSRYVSVLAEDTIKDFVRGAVSEKMEALSFKNLMRSAEGSAIVKYPPWLSGDDILSALDNIPDVIRRRNEGDSSARITDEVLQLIKDLGTEGRKELKAQLQRDKEEREQEQRDLVKEPLYI